MNSIYIIITNTLCIIFYRSIYPIIRICWISRIRINRCHLKVRILYNNFLYICHCLSRSICIDILNIIFTFCGSQRSADILNCNCRSINCFTIVNHDYTCPISQNCRLFSIFISFNKCFSSFSAYRNVISSDTDFIAIIFFYCRKTIHNKSIYCLTQFSIDRDIFLRIIISIYTDRFCFFSNIHQTSIMNRYNRIITTSLVKR